MKKKVLLIHPFGTTYGNASITPSIPMGLLYLTSYLRSYGFDVYFLDALAANPNRIVKVGRGRRCGLSEFQLKKKILKINPDIVGIGMMFTAHLDDSLEVARIVKSVNKNILVVTGGSHVSVDPISVAKNRNIDVAVFGEGEETLLEIVKGVDFSLIKGIAYRKNNKIIKNEDRNLIPNLDSLPFPAWDVLDYSKYLMVSNFNMRKPVFPLISSRGCPGHCLYCSVNAVWQHRWRGRSAVNVVDEMEFLIKNYGAREFAFQDDSVSVDKDRLDEICNEIINRKLDIKWTTPNGIAHWTLTKHLLKKMKKAGCYRITFGIESGDQELRRWVGKPYSLKQATELTKYANNLGFWTLATNIIGFPYETLESMEKTHKYSLESDVDLAFIFRLGPRPGTPIYEIFKKEGWLMKDRHLLFSEDVACRTKYFSGEEIIKLQNMFYKKFIIKRWLTPYSIIRITKKIKSWEDFSYFLKIIWHGVKLSYNLISNKVGVTSKTLKV